MNVKEAVFKNIEEIIGLPKDELENMLDENLIESELVDSLSMAELITSLQNDLNIKIDLSNINIRDFATVNGIIEFVSGQIK